MGSVKVRIRIDNSEFEAEGSRDDVDTMLGVWWEKVLTQSEEPNEASRLPTDAAKAKRPKAAKSRTNPAANGRSADNEKFDANQLANKIKQLPNASALTKSVWHTKDRYNKVALVCMMANQALTSGDIHRVLEALQIKIGLPAVSVAISKNANKFLNSAPRKAGGTVPQYTLTSAAAAALQQVIDDAS